MLLCGNTVHHLKPEIFFCPFVPNPVTQLCSILRALPASSLPLRRRMENLTASEIAGFSVGALLLCASIAAPKVDAFISASQRSFMGMCSRCGDLRMIACTQCKGVGSIRKGGLFSILDDFLEPLGDGRMPSQSIPCTKCQSRGRMLCPECSKFSQLH